jgi:hypothetical protein
MGCCPGLHIGNILKERNIEIVGAYLATRHGFTQVPNLILATYVLPQQF